MTELDKGVSEKRLFPIFNKLSWTSISNKQNAGDVDKVTSLTKKVRADKDQFIIDAGQKNMGPVSCKVCGGLYSQEDEADTEEHAKYHDLLNNRLKYTSWKKEKVVRRFPDGKVVVITPSDAQYALKKANEVREIVDKDLGFSITTLPAYKEWQMYLFVSSEQKVVGCIVAEPVKEGYKMLDFSENKPEGAMLACETKPQAAVCGINRLWTLASHRKRNIASRLMNSVRCYFFGTYYTIPVTEIAFSDPTPDGREFAIRYTGTSNFLVYR